VKPLARGHIYKNKTYKKTRKTFRGVACVLWIGMSVTMFVHQRSKLHTEVDSTEARNVHDRVKRSSGGDIDPEKLKPEEQEYYPYRPKYIDACKKALPRDKYDITNEEQVLEWDDWFDKHRDIYKERHNFNRYFDDETQDLDIYGKTLCCLEEQDKHHHHQGAKSEFPNFGLFTDEELKSGAFLIHLLAALYMFAALAVVCDDYFVPALERISEELQLSEDVAGATFMAAGSSAPELFTSMIGVFVAKSDIGIGTIVGSAVFNILVIIAACGLFVDGETKLSVWPLFRDSCFYFITIVILLAVIFPEFDIDKCPEMTPIGVFDCSSESQFSATDVEGKTFSELCTCPESQLKAATTDDPVTNKEICSDWELVVERGYKKSKDAEDYCQIDKALGGHYVDDAGTEIGNTGRFDKKFLYPEDGHHCQCTAIGKEYYGNCHLWKPSFESLETQYNCSDDTNYRREKGKYLQNCECAVYSGFSRMDLLGNMGKCGKSEVFMWEALCMLIAYSFYIIIMKYNAQLESKFSAITGIVRDKHDESEGACGDESNMQNEIPLMPLDHAVLTQQISVKLTATPLMDRRNRKDTCASQLSTADQANVEGLVDATKDGEKPKMEFDNLGMRVMMSSDFAPKTRLRMAAKAIANHPDEMIVAKETQEDGTVKSILIQRKQTGAIDVDPQYEQNYNMNNNNNSDEGSNASKAEDEEDEDDEGPQNPWELPAGGFTDTTKFLVGWPINIFLYYTVPQCGKEEQKHLYLVSFFMSTVWIAAYSYVMVWMVAYCGFAMGIPDTIMGLTFLAAGTSVPDTIASVLVARQGMGDMAVSNSIGSNVFDILLGLALPWAAQMFVAGIVPPPPCANLAQFTDTVVINSSGLVISCSMLLASLIFVVTVIHFNGWKLSFKSGVLISVAYLFFICGSIWNETAAAMDDGMTCSKAIVESMNLF